MGKQIPLSGGFLRLAKEKRGGQNERAKKKNQKEIATDTQLYAVCGDGGYHDAGVCDTGKGGRRDAVYQCKWRRNR